MSQEHSDLLRTGKFFFLFTAATLMSVRADPPPEMWTSEVVRRYEAPEVTQGAVAGDEAFYTISNREVVKYRKDTGEEAARWTDAQDGPLVHLNAGFLKDGKLYAAHSNFPHLPMKSSVEIWDAQTLRHLGRHDFGETDGSLTWMIHHQGNWYGVFAHYAGKGGDPRRGPEASRLVKFDEEWQPLQEWKFPPDLIDRFAGYSSSCGAVGPDGYLYLTGHSEKEMYVLEFPREGTSLQWLATISIPFKGQGFTWDPGDSRLVYGINRKRSVVVARVQVPEPPDGPASTPAP